MPLVLMKVLGHRVNEQREIDGWLVAENEVPVLRLLSPEEQSVALEPLWAVAIESLSATLVDKKREKL